MLYIEKYETIFCLCVWTAERLSTFPSSTLKTRPKCFVIIFIFYLVVTNAVTLSGHRLFLPDVDGTNFHGLNKFILVHSNSFSGKRREILIWILIFSREKKTNKKMRKLTIPLRHYIQSSNIKRGRCKRYNVLCSCNDFSIHFPV